MAQDGVPSLYFHATLYEFTSEAIKQVLAHFTCHIPHSTARCSYDRDLEAFRLECPRGLGPDADAALARAIKACIDTELQSAPGSEERACVRPFAESVVDDVEDFEAPSFSAKARAEHGDSVAALCDTILLHALILDARASGLIKFYRMSEMSTVLDRLLSPVGDAAAKAVHFGMICRSVRWDPSLAEHVFNGCTRRPISLEMPDKKEILASTTFLPLGEAQPPTEDVSPAVHPFSLVGEALSVNLFLAGMGEIQLDTVDTPSQPPIDHKKFMAQPVNMSEGLGRVRIPAGASDTLATQESEAEDDDEPDVSTNRDAFSRLLAETAVDDSEDGSDDKYADTDRHCIPCNEVDVNAALTHVPLLGRSFSSEPTTAPKVSCPSSVTDRTTAIKDLAERPSSSKLSIERSDMEPTLPFSKADTIPTICPSTKVHNQTSDACQNEETFPYHGSRYARLDKFGLIGDPAHHAQWARDNRSPHTPRGCRSSIVRRTPHNALDSISVINSASSGTYTGPFSHSQGTCGDWPEIRSDLFVHPSKSWQARHRWREQALPMCTSDSDVIDVAIARCPSPLKTPSPPLDLCLQSDSIFQDTRMLSSDGSRRRSTSTMIPRSSKHSSFLHDVQRPVPNPQYSEGEIVELLQNSHDALYQTRSTMRQKAGARKKKSHKGGKRLNIIANVHLPLPDPIIQPQRLLCKSLHNAKSALPDELDTDSCIQKAVSATWDDSKLLTTRARVLELALSKENTVGYAVHGEAVKASKSHASDIGRLLEKVAEHCRTDGLELSVRFGMVLLRPITNKELLGGTMDSATFQSRVQDADQAIESHFIPRITTAEHDTLFMLSVLGGSAIQGTTHYEVHVKDAEGKSHVIHIDQSSVGQTTTVRRDMPLGILYLHYPMRVWDAESSIRRLNSDGELTHAADSFAASMQTFGDVPAFQAKVESKDFAVEKVCAIRRFTRTVAENVKLQVQEVQELCLEAITSATHNLRALAGARATMIEKNRLWWEGALTVDATCVPAARIQALVDDFVNSIDGVGYNNRGPWELRHAPSEDVKVSLW